MRSLSLVIPPVYYFSDFIHVLAIPNFFTAMDARSVMPVEKIRYALPCPPVMNAQAIPGYVTRIGYVLRSHYSEYVRAFAIT
jgi:hypothetical protein